MNKKDKKRINHLKMTLNKSVNDKHTKKSKQKEKNWNKIYEKLKLI
jgi:hypothetical protein